MSEREINATMDAIDKLMQDSTPDNANFWQIAVCGFHLLRVFLINQNRTAEALEIIAKAVLEENAK